MGYRECKGIWVTWKVQQSAAGFQIWPLSEDDPPDLEEAVEQEWVSPAKPVYIT